MSGKRNTMSYLKVGTVQEKAICVLWFFETKSFIKMQRRCFKQFQETGSVLHRKGAGKPSISQEVVDRIQEAWTSYVPRKARMLKLFSILQH
jgi:hypothetical protein